MSSSGQNRELDMIQSMVANFKLDPPELMGDDFIPHLVCSIKIDEKDTSSIGCHEADVIAHEEDHC
jgi:hypothetical protein